MDPVKPVRALFNDNAARRGTIFSSAITELLDGIRCQVPDRFVRNSYRPVPT